jgi:thiol-disulfide isomerase/thioredoxin
MSVAPGMTPRPQLNTGGGFSPGGVGATGAVNSPTLPNPASTDKSLPKPNAVEPNDKPMNPERIVNGPSTQPMNSPIPASIPGGPPPLPKVPEFNPSLPPTPGTEKKSALPLKQGANFALVDLMGRPWNFATSKHGSLVLIEFMTTKCVPCLQSLPGLKDLQAKYGAAGLQLVGVVCDEVPQNERVELAAKYHREKSLNYMLFVEPGAKPGVVRDRYIGDRGYPTVVLLNAAGDVLWTGHPSSGRPQLEAAIQANLGK